MNRQLAELTQMRQMVRSGRARNIRVAARLTLAEVAQEVGVHPSTVHYWEVHGRIPRGEPATRYARLLADLEAMIKP